MIEFLALEVYTSRAIVLPRLFNILFAGEPGGRILQQEEGVDLSLLQDCVQTHEQGAH